MVPEFPGEHWPDFRRAAGRSGRGGRNSRDGSEGAGPGLAAVLVGFGLHGVLFAVPGDGQGHDGGGGLQGNRVSIRVRRQSVSERDVSGF